MSSLCSGILKNFTGFFFGGDTSVQEEKSVLNYRNIWRRHPLPHIGHCTDTLHGPNFVNARKAENNCLVSL